MITNARKRAKQILRKQYKKTGIAILGKPSQTLNHDPIFQGDLKQANVKVGEDLALALLTSELLTLDTVQVPRSQQKLYTGRSQHPKLKIQTLINETTQDHCFCCEHLAYWGDLKGTLSILVQHATAGNLQYYRVVVQALQSQLVFAK